MKINKLLILPLIAFPILAGCNEDEDSLFSVNETAFNKAIRFEGVEYVQVYYSYYFLLHTSSWDNTTMHRKYIEYAPGVVKETDSEGTMVRYFIDNGKTYEEKIEDNQVKVNECPATYMIELSETSFFHNLSYSDIKDSYDKDSKHYFFQTTQSGKTYDNLLRFYKGKVVEFYSECFINDSALIIQELTFSYKQTTPAQITLPE